MANSHKIQLRTGCFCNPGACQRHLNQTEKDLLSHFEVGDVVFLDILLSILFQKFFLNVDNITY